MSVKSTTDPDVRQVELEVEVPGTPEEVWRAIATGPGTSAWFVPTTIDEREGGDVAFDLGGGVVAPGVVTAWEPPRRFAYEERGWSPGAPPLATEIRVETRAGGRTVVRMVHSLFTERSDWDDELASIEKGWPPFFRVLQLYLGEFADQPCAAFRVTAHPPGPEDAAWGALTRALGLADAAPGTAVATPAAAPPLAGVVDRTGDGDLVLRVERPAPGVALLAAHEWGDQIHAVLQLYLYGPDADEARAAAEPAWREWLERHAEERSAAAG